MNFVTEICNICNYVAYVARSFPIRLVIEGLLKGFDGEARTLSEVDSVGLHEYLEVVKTWITNQPEEYSESEDEDKHESRSEGELCEVARTED